MSDIHANPEEIRAFSYHLDKFAMDLRGLKDVTRSRMTHLGQSWKDNENVQFAAKYEQAIKPMDELIRTVEEYGAFLKRKAAALDLFLNTKM